MESLPFLPVNIAVLTVSDTRDESNDTSGQILVDRVKDAGHEFAGRAGGLGAAAVPAVGVLCARGG